MALLTEVTLTFTSDSKQREGIEPSSSVWKTVALPLSYGCKTHREHALRGALPMATPPQTGGDRIRTCNLLREVTETIASVDVLRTREQADSESG